ncbi:MAG: sensor histidine kinase [Planctomycetaceae bacterium]
MTDDRLDAAGASHALILRELAWGVAAVGVVGSLAGVMLGYVVALGVRRTIRRLQVQLRDTAGMILETQSEIVVTSEGPEQDLDTQIRLLTHEVGAVVARLRQRELEVLRSEQLAALGQLAAGVAHEIRNPLTSIKLLVQGAHGPQATSRLTSEDLSIVEQEVLRMENSLQTFLDFARPPRLERRRVDLGSLVAQTFELLRGRAAKQRVELRFTSPGAPLCREVDPVQLRQVLLNLALNSLDVLPSGGWLQFDLWSDPQGAAELQLCDNGPGISPEISGKLFQPFQSNKETGLGLGLVISRRIVEEHGGTLEQVPRPQGGACFRLRLPPTPEKPEHVVDPVGG